VPGDPVDLLVERAGDEVEGCGRLGDLDVVDDPDRLGVAPFGQANREPHAGGRYRGDCAPNALLSFKAPPP
jgi:hypothetical protein